MEADDPVPIEEQLDTNQDETGSGVGPDQEQPNSASLVFFGFQVSSTICGDTQSKSKHGRKTHGMFQKLKSDKCTLKAYCTECTFELNLPASLEMTAEDVLIMKTREATLELALMRVCLAEIIADLLNETLYTREIFRLICEFFEYGTSKMPPTPPVTPSRRRRIVEVALPARLKTPKLPQKSLRNGSDAATGGRVHGKDNLQCQLITNKKIKENDRLRETVKQLQDVVEARDREIKDLRTKLSSQVKEAQKEAAQIKEKKQCEFRNAIAAKNLEIQRLSRDNEAVKKKLDKELCKIRRLTKTVDDQKFHQVGCCSKLFAVEMNNKDVTEANAKLTKELDQKVQEIHKLSALLEATKNKQYISPEQKKKILDRSRCTSTSRISSKGTSEISPTPPPLSPFSDRSRYTSRISGKSTSEVIRTLPPFGPHSECGDSILSVTRTKRKPMGVPESGGGGDVPRDVPKFWLKNKVKNLKKIRLTRHRVTKPLVLKSEAFKRIVLKTVVDHENRIRTLEGSSSSREMVPEVSKPPTLQRSRTFTKTSSPATESEHKTSLSLPS